MIQEWGSIPSRNPHLERTPYRRKAGARKLLAKEKDYFTTLRGRSKGSCHADLPGCFAAMRGSGMGVWTERTHVADSLALTEEVLTGYDYISGVG